MSAVLAALAPVMAVIAIGWALRRFDFPGAGFWSPAERLTYYLLFPALLVRTLAAAPLADLTVAPMALAVAASIALGALLMIAVRRPLGVGGPAFSSLFQGAIRQNTYAGMAAAMALYGSAGVILAAIVVATFIPLVNLLSVVVLSRYAGKDTASLRDVVRAIVANPLILACAAGVALNAAGLGVPPGLDAILDIFGRAALPFGLLCVGAGLSFAGLRHVRLGIAVVCAVKLIAVPAFAAVACTVLGVEGLSARVVVLFAALPTATSAYILARQMGGDSALMAQIVAATTVVSAATIPAILLLFG
jgi:hypothetical protein